MLAFLSQLLDSKRVTPLVYLIPCFCLKWSPTAAAKCYPGFVTHEDYNCLMEKIGLLDELYSGMSYSVVIVGHEFTVNESCVCVCAATVCAFSHSMPCMCVCVLV